VLLVNKTFNKQAVGLLLCIVILIAPVASAFASQDDLSGFTLKQLDAAIREIGMATGKLYSVLTFDSEERDGVNIAVLGGSNSGRQVAVLHRVNGGFDVQWRSGKLTDDFAVSSSSRLEIADVGDEQVVEFSGCAAHQCGLVDGVFGFLLYSPNTHQVFFAHYRFDERKPLGSFGSLDFSNNTLEPRNERYKTALQNAAKRVLHQ
jgi:hypothetical protein